MKHILPLTYEPKIPDVISGKCTQTIRPMSNKKEKSKGDFVMFHGWAGKPYRSKWSFRTPYWELTEVITVDIREHAMGYYEGNTLMGINTEIINSVAMADGFIDYEHMYNQFVKMYGKRFLENNKFQVLQWKYTL